MAQRGFEHFPRRSRWREGGGQAGTTGQGADVTPWGPGVKREPPLRGTGCTVACVPCAWAGGRAPTLARARSHRYPSCQVINRSTTELPLTVSYDKISLGRLRFWIHMQDAVYSLQQFGEGAVDRDLEAGCDLRPQREERPERPLLARCFNPVPVGASGFCLS